MLCAPHLKTAMAQYKDWMVNFGYWGVKAAIYEVSSAK